jgi:site-specific DNA-methyltransferase (adenine-specific)
VSTLSNGKVHITQKPLELMQEIVKVCPSGGTVFDPFMGSGTTGVASLRSGRKFVGCETVPQYFDVAFKRCLEAAENCAY